MKNTTGQPIRHQNLCGSPTSFDDRKELGSQADEKGDLISALIEYSAALAIKPDGDVYIRRGDIYARLGSKKLALTQYKLAQKAGESRAEDKIKGMTE